MKLKTTLTGSNYNHYKLFLIISFILLSNCLYSIESKIVQKKPVAFGRGNAFVASGDDINSLNYNPAGLGNMYYNEFNLSYNDAYSLGLLNGTFDLAFSILNVINIAGGYDYLYFNDSELMLANQNINFALARNLFFKGLLAGVAFNFYMETVKYDGEIIFQKNNYAADIGFIYDDFDFIQLLTPLTLGIVAKKLISNQEIFGEQELTSWQLFNRKTDINIGLGYFFFDQLSTELTWYPETYNLGAEYWLTMAEIQNVFVKAAEKKEKEYSFSQRFIALRVGVIMDKEQLSQRNFLNKIKFSGGLGFNRLMVTLNYGFMYNDLTKFDHAFSLSYKFGFGTSYIQEIETEVKDIFSSLYKSYKDLSIGYVKLKNNSKKNITIDVDFYVKDYMNAPTRRKVILRPDREQLFPLFAIFNENVLDLEEDIPLQGEITYTYIYNKKKIKKTISKTFILYEKNAFTWNNKEQIAVFITPKDPVVADFTRNIIQLYKGETSGILPKNFEKAMQVFNALGTYGITYVRDPNSAYAQSKITKDFVDNIQFPSETLQSKTGDCDDSAVLYCSMLESIGIQTAVVDVPGHVLMMFNTGVPASQASKISQDSKDYIIKNNTVWVLIETTMFQKGFFKAWKEGMNEYHKWNKN